MHEETLKWIEKAEGDFEGANILSKKRSKNLLHIIGFSCQQCAEKYLKAFLIEQNIPFTKTHDLTKKLLPLCTEIDQEFKVLFNYLEMLDPYAVEFRYPGEEYTFTEIRTALASTKKIRRFVRGKLGLEKQRRLL